jgi:hypothetical protein
MQAVCHAGNVVLKLLNKTGLHVSGPSIQASELFQDWDLRFHFWDADSEHPAFDPIDDARGHSMIRVDGKNPKIFLDREPLWNESSLLRGQPGLAA